MAPPFVSTFSSASPSRHSVSPLGARRCGVHPEYPRDARDVGLGHLVPDEPVDGRIGTEVGERAVEHVADRAHRVQGGPRLVAGGTVERELRTASAGPRPLRRAAAARRDRDDRRACSRRAGPVGTSARFPSDAGSRGSDVRRCDAVPRAPTFRPISRGSSRGAATDDRVTPPPPVSRTEIATGMIVIASTNTTTAFTSGSWLPVRIAPKIQSGSVFCAPDGERRDDHFVEREREREQRAGDQRGREHRQRDVAERLERVRAEVGRRLHQRRRTSGGAARARCCRSRRCRTSCGR